MKALSTLSNLTIIISNVLSEAFLLIPLILFITHYTINFLSLNLDYFILLGRLVSVDSSFLMYKIRIIVILGFK